MIKTIFDKSKPGKNHYSIPKIKIESKLEIPEKYLSENIDLPDLSEIEVARHYTNLSTMNFGVDNGMYPLGSCTMKYNPKINEKVAGHQHFANLHPLNSQDLSQGALQIIFELSNYLSEISGMSRFSLIPAAGAHGELAGVMIIRKYFEKLKQKRKIILIPDSAHGTNPASVTMCGFEVKEVPSTAEGDTDIEKLKEIVNQDVAAMMLTSPNTLGLFDRNIKEIADILHKNGSLFYCDGANLNAVMGQAKITDMGFDLMHINLHKTFSTPHGGGGPGSGPIGVIDKLKDFLPLPSVVKEGDTYQLDYNYPDAIGRIHSFYGNFQVLIKAYTYIRVMGAAGINEVSENAVLNANYLRAILKDYYNQPIDRTTMHEFILNDKDLPGEVTTNDIAKRILDYGYHAPTVYFPLLIKNAMMFEPTETETKESLDNFIEAMIKIRKEIDDNPDLVKNAPSRTKVAKVDAVTAARKPILKWDDISG